MLKMDEYSDKVLKDRREALLSMDEDRIVGFCLRYGFSVPHDEKRFWAAVHQAVVRDYGIDYETRFNSLRWLYSEGLYKWPFAEEGSAAK